MNYTILNGLTRIDGSNRNECGPYYPAKRYCPSKDLNDLSKNPKNNPKNNHKSSDGNTKDNDPNFIAYNKVVLPKKYFKNKLHSTGVGSNKPSPDKVSEELQNIAEEYENPKHRFFD